MPKKSLKTLALGAAAAGLCASSAPAALDTTYSHGDIILAFHSSSNDTVIEYNLGSGISYRDKTANELIGNLNDDLRLSNAFGGANWYQNTNVYLGAFAGNSNSTTAGTGGNTTGDYNSTIYYTVARTAAGAVGTASSTGFSMTTLEISNAAGMGIQLGNTFSSTSTTQATPGIASFATSLSGDNVYTWDDFNAVGDDTPFDGNINGVLNDQLGTGWDFNTTFAGISNVVAVLDLYRLSRFPSPTSAARENTYEGSLVLTQDGNIRFVAAVPEPTSAGLLGLAGITLAALRRRRRSA